MPLNYSGQLIEDFEMSFENGQVVTCHARRGEELLRKLIEADEGARRLGEVALVPASSPVGASGRLFYSTLFDENAASHLALGRAYTSSLKDGARMSSAEFTAAGGNLSLAHTDFMIGSTAMDVDGLGPGAAAEPLMRQGEWCFEV
jgi:aminopeptidase